MGGAVLGVRPHGCHLPAAPRPLTTAYPQGLPAFEVRPVGRLQVGIEREDDLLEIRAADCRGAKWPAHGESAGTARFQAHRPLTDEPCLLRLNQSADTRKQLGVSKCIHAPSIPPAVTGAP